MVPRIQKERLKQAFNSSKITLVRGPQMVGKLQLIISAIEDLKKTFSVIECHNKKSRSIIEERLIDSKNVDFIILSEAQLLDNLQSIVERALTDQIKPALVIHCSFNPSIDPELMEALRVEKLDIKVFAPSFYESAQHFGLPKEEELLEERLIYGNYPAVLDDLEHAELTLRELIQDVITTKLGANDRINKGDKLLRVMQLLAFSIGEPISYNEIGERCGLDNETVERYITLLEDAFVLIKLNTYHTEQRYELKKAHCIYFQDNGIRNALISNFNPTFLRNDMPELWKNYVVSERVKWIRLSDMEKDVLFWRTHTRQQMDFVEVGEQTFAYKADWEKRKKVKIPAMFTELYPSVKSSVLNRSTYWNFLSRKN